MEYVNVDGLRIAYRSAGTGPPLVLLHGGLEDSRAWRHDVSSFADAFRVVAWDAPGCGASGDPPLSWRLPEYADAAAGLLRSAVQGRAHVLGLSFGSGLALELYRRHSELVRSLVLVSAYAGWAGSLPPAEVEERTAHAERNAQRPPAEWVDEFLATMFDAATPAETVEETRTMMLDSRPAGMVPMVRGFAEADLRDVLGEVRVPTLIVHGENDRRSTLPVAQALASAIPAARLVVIPHAGHAVNAEAPDAFHAAVRLFLGELA